MVEVEPISLKLAVCKQSSALKAQNRMPKVALAALDNQMACFNAPIISQEKNTYGSFPEDQQIKFVTWQIPPESRHSFINSTLEVYAELQEEWKTAQKNPIGVKQFLKNISTKYQTAIFDHARRDAKGKDAPLFSGIHAIWHLAHIVCFENSKNPCSFEISSWMQLNFTEQLTESFERITKLAHPTQDQSYWPFIHNCVLRGFFTAATQVLSHLESCKGAAAGNPVSAFATLVKSFPRTEAYSSNSSFKAAWTKWNQEALFLYDEGSLSTLKIPEADREHFRILFGILAGNEDIIIAHSSTWQDALIGLLFFKYPDYDVDHLSSIAVTLKASFPVENILDEIQLSLLEQNLGSAIALAAQFDWWLVTHLVDLLEKANLLRDAELKGIGEWYSVNYSEHLFGSPSLWKPAAEYLLLCPTFGKAMLEELLPQVELDSSSKADQILDFCKSHGLKTARLTILRILGCRNLKQKNYTQAISFYMDANDLHYIVYIVDELLESYMKSGNNVYESVVKSLPPGFLFKSPRLAFLARYCEFQTLYKNKEFKKAADLVVLLFSSGAAPKKFWRSILLDTLPLLEGQLQVFSVEQVMELMRCAEASSLYEASKFYRPSQNCVMSKPENTDDEFNVIRLALSRALAAAIIEN